jgi:hypothetical protein
MRDNNVEIVQDTLSKKYYLIDNGEEVEISKEMSRKLGDVLRNREQFCPTCLTRV